MTARGAAGTGTPGAGAAAPHRCRSGAGAYRARGALAVLVALVALLPACGARQAGPATEPLRVLVYNIHAGTDADRRDNLARVAELVRSTGADLVLLQEVDSATRRSGGVHQLAELARLTGFHSAFGRALDYQGGGFGNAVLSRWPIETDTLILLRVEPIEEQGGPAYEPRGVLRARVASPAGTLTVLSTHLDAGRREGYRLQQVEGLLAAAGPPPEERLVLLGGDLNAEPGSATIERLRQAGWVDAWSACGEGDGYTFPAGEPRKRIDYLFLPPGARCDSARVLPSDASDHRPLLVVLRP